MNKKNLEILGLSEGATAEEIKAAYEKLKAKYSEERFLEGEAGNNAAKMLTKLETAYKDILSELNEDAAANDGGASFAKVEELIKANDISEAQRVLDSFNERNGQWHYLQSVVFYRKNWMNESKKQLEIAIQLEPDNQKYKDTYQKLNEKINYDASARQNNAQGNGQGQYQSNYQGQNMTGGPEDQMGGGFCANCMNFCCTMMCLDMICGSCCR